MHRESLILFAILLLLLLSLFWIRSSRHSKEVTTPTKPKIPRPLRPCSPDDCTLCCAQMPPAAPTDPPPPWNHVKSGRGRRKQVDTEDLACPNHVCRYQGITDAAASMMPAFTLSSATVLTARMSASRTFAARPVAASSRHDETRRCTVSRPLPSASAKSCQPWPRSSTSLPPCASLVTSKPPSRDGSPALAGMFKASIAISSATSTCGTSNAPEPAAKARDDP
jgi:hypothetical protein